MVTWKSAKRVDFQCSHHKKRERTERKREGVREGRKEGLIR